MKTVVVDAHLHLWNQEVLAYPWMQGRDLPLASLPSDELHQNSGAQTFCDAIAIEAGARDKEQEIAWFAQFIEYFDFLKGMVAAANYSDPNFDFYLAKCCNSTSFICGLRDNFESLPENELNKQAHRTGVLRTLSSGLTVDICIQARQITECRNFLDSIANIRGDANKIVIDHLGKPLISGGDRAFEDWKQEMGKLASIPGLMVKISGLAGQLGISIRLADLLKLARPYIFAILDMFGTERVMFGSDHPVSTKACGITREYWLQTVKQLLKEKNVTKNELDAVMAGNARKFYKIE